MSFAFRTARSSYVLLIASVSVGFIFRFGSLDEQSFWLDEAWTAHLLWLPFSDMVTTIPTTESTPHLYYIFAWIWTQIFGTGEVGLRSLSALFGLATVPVAFFLAKKVATPGAGVFAAALVATNPFLVWFSQEARAYSLLVLLAAGGLYFFLDVLETGRPRSAVLWTVAAALSVATHYFAVFLVAPQAVALVLRGRSHPAVRRAVVALVGVGVAFLPLALVQRKEGYGFESTSLVTRLLQVPKQFLVGFDAPAELFMATIAGALVVLACLNLRGEWQNQGVIMLGLVGLASVLVPAGVALSGIDLFDARNVVASLIPFCILAAIGFSKTNLSVVAGAGLVAVFVIVNSAVAVQDELHRTDWRSAAAAIGRSAYSRVIVVAPYSSSGGRPFDIYVPGIELLSERGVRVREIVVVVMSDKETGGDLHTAELSYTPPEGFDRWGGRSDTHFALAVYRAKRARFVEPTRLERGVNEVAKPVTALLQLPGRPLQHPTDWP